MSYCLLAADTSIKSNLIIFMAKEETIETDPTIVPGELLSNDRRMVGFCSSSHVGLGRLALGVRDGVEWGSKPPKNFP